MMAEVIEANSTSQRIDDGKLRSSIIHLPFSTCTMKRVAIIGGGIAGLAAAHRVAELAKEKSLSIELTLLEATERLGGAIATERIGDFLVEAGPDSFITEKPWALRPLRAPGPTSRLISTQAEYQKIYIVHEGKLEPLPEGFFLLAPTRMGPFVRTPIFSWRGKLRMARRTANSARSFER